MYLPSWMNLRNFNMYKVSYIEARFTSGIRWIILYRNHVLLKQTVEVIPYFVRNICNSYAKTWNYLSLFCYSLAFEDTIFDDLIDHNITHLYLVQLRKLQKQQQQQTTLSKVIWNFVLWQYIVGNTTIRESYHQGPYLF